MSADESFNSDSESSLPSPIIERESDDDSDSNERMGVRPYRFEPRRAEGTASGSDNRPTSQPFPDRRVRDEGDISWCMCGKCRPIECPENRFCCRESDKTKTKIDEGNKQTNQPFICITTHPGFKSVCLDRWFLETAYYAYRQEWGRIQKPQHQKFRYVAYRQLVRWCWGFLGKNNRTPLPACVMSCIRNTFPANDGQYKNFEWPNN